MTKQKKPVDPVVSAYMRKLAKCAGLINKQKGPEYFKWVRSHRKPKVKKEDNPIGRGV